MKLLRFGSRFPSTQSLNPRPLLERFHLQRAIMMSEKEFDEDEEEEEDEEEDWDEEDWEEEEEE